jgi:hypothetical protein
VPSRTSTMGQDYDPSTTRHSCRAGPDTINEPCIGLVRQTQFIWPSITPHDNHGHRLSCRHLVRHPIYFLSPLMPLPPRHPFLSRGRGSRTFHSSPRGRFTAYTHHRFCHHRTSRSSSRFSSRSTSPTCCPCQRSSSSNLFEKFISWWISMHPLAKLAYAVNFFFHFSAFAIATCTGPPSKAVYAFDVATRSSEGAASLAERRKG